MWALSMQGLLNDNGSSVRVPREIDFVVNSGGKRTYIQSAYAMPTDEKAEIELRPFTAYRRFIS